MKNLILLFVFIPFFLFSQTKRDLKKYNRIVELIEQNELETALIETYKLLDKNKEIPVIITKTKYTIIGEHNFAESKSRGEEALSIL